MVSRIAQYRSNAPQLTRVGRQAAAAGNIAEALDAAIALLGILASAVEILTDNQKELYIAIVESRNSQTQQQQRKNL